MHLRQKWKEQGLFGESSNENDPKIAINNDFNDREGFAQINRWREFHSLGHLLK